MKKQIIMLALLSTMTHYAAHALTYGPLFDEPDPCAAQKAQIKAHQAALKQCNAQNAQTASQNAYVQTMIQNQRAQNARIRSSARARLNRCRAWIRKYNSKIRTCESAVSSCTTTPVYDEPIDEPPHYEPVVPPPHRPHRRPHRTPRHGSGHHTPQKTQPSGHGSGHHTPKSQHGGHRKKANRPGILLI